MSVNCFPMQLQIIPYTGPPEPKPTSRRNISKRPFNRHKDLGLGRDLSISPAPTSLQAADVDPASTSEKTDKLEDSGSGCGDIGCAGGVPLPDQQGVEDGHFVPRVSSEEGLSEESSSRLALFEDNPPECASVMADDQPGPDADNDDDGYSDDLDLSTLDHDGFGDADFLTKDQHKTEALESVSISEMVDRPDHQEIGLRGRELSSAPSTPSNGSSIVAMEQQANGDTLSENHVTMHEPQEPLKREAGEHGKLAHLGSTGCHSSDGSDDTEDDSGNHRTSLSHKRQRSLPGKQHSQMLRTTSKRPGLGTRNRGTNSKRCYSDVSSDSNSESSDRGRHIVSNKRRRSASRSRRSRSRSGADEDDEYEVERILEARVYRRKLRYRVKWLGYEDDPMWYDASNFKNSPHKLREFHIASPTCPGPPERLDLWLRCWDEDRDAAEHSDDNKPQRSDTGRKTLRKSEPCGYSLRRCSRLTVSTVQRQEAML